MLRSVFLIFLLPQIGTLAHAASAPWVGATLSGLRCTGGGQGFGPFDYTQRNSFKDALNLVVSAHFTPDVENLIKGNAGYLEGDLDYTLRAWPNHHNALLSIIRYQIQANKKIRKGQLASPPECYLQRAIHFSPQDAASYALYGYYLRKSGHLEDAAKYYEKAIKISPENEKVAYSFSLLLIDLKRYDEAVNYAKIAYRNRHTPKGLKQKLEKLGVWVE